MQNVGAKTSRRLIPNPGYSSPLLAIIRHCERSEAIAETKRLLRFARNDNKAIEKAIEIAAKQTKSAYAD